MRVRSSSPQQGNPKTRQPDSGIGNQNPETGIRNPESDTGIQNLESKTQSKQVLQIRKNYLAELLPVENESSNTRTFRDAFVMNITAPLNNLRTIKFKVQPTNAFYATVNQDT